MTIHAHSERSLHRLADPGGVLILDLEDRSETSPRIDERPRRASETQREPCERQRRTHGHSCTSTGQSAEPDPRTMRDPPRISTGTKDKVSSHMPHARSPPSSRVHVHCAARRSHHIKRHATISGDARPQDSRQPPEGRTKTAAGAWGRGEAPAPSQRRRTWTATSSAHSTTFSQGTPTTDGRDGPAETPATRPRHPRGGRAPCTPDCGALAAAECDGPSPW